MKIYTKKVSKRERRTTKVMESIVSVSKQILL